MEKMWLVLIPFAGTVLGSALVYLIKDKINPKIEKFLLGFASGVMIAASVWSLIIPSIEYVEEDMGNLSFIPAAVGIALGFAFLLLLDTIIPHLHTGSDEPEGKNTNKVSKKAMMVFAVTLHNFPEGMAVGVTIAGAINGSNVISMMGALSMCIGIAIQNFPEGAIVSLPLKVEGKSKNKAFLLGSLTGAVEPIAAIITILLTSLMTPILPYLLSFAAGAMLYVVVEELIPESQQGKHTNIATVGFAFGFILMMILDITLG